jgi:hypothetical protein
MQALTTLGGSNSTQALGPQAGSNLVAGLHAISVGVDASWAPVVLQADLSRGLRLQHLVGEAEPVAASLEHCSTTDTQQNMSHMAFDVGPVLGVSCAETAVFNAPERCSMHQSAAADQSDTQAQGDGMLAVAGLPLQSVFIVLLECSVVEPAGQPSHLVAAVLAANPPLYSPLGQHTAVVPA